VFLVEPPKDSATLDDVMAKLEQLEAQIGELKSTQ
jgi:hypothetical protein